MNKKRVTILSIIAFFVILWVLMTACACDPSHYVFTDEDFDNVISVELIEYINPEQKQFVSWVPDHSSDLKPFDFAKMNVLEALDEDRISDFIDSLCDCNILYTYYAYDSPNSTCIKINYTDGGFMILWSNYIDMSYSGYIGKFFSDGRVDEFIGCFEGLPSYLQLVNNYFNMQI